MSEVFPFLRDHEMIASVERTDPATGVDVTTASLRDRSTGERLPDVKIYFIRDDNLYPLQPGGTVKVVAGEAKMVCTEANGQEMVQELTSDYANGAYVYGVQATLQRVGGEILVLREGL